MMRLFDNIIDNVMLEIITIEIDELNPPRKTKTVMI